MQAAEQTTSAKFAATPNERGEYHLLGLPAGDYVFTGEQPGFRTQRQSGITLRIGDRTEFQIQAGEQAQSINVTAEAPLQQLSVSYLTQRGPDTARR